MSTYVLQAVGFANGKRCPHKWQYLKSFDFEYENGLGYGEFTSSVEEAKHFADFREALEFWRTVSKIRPTRPDGKPNRPMTALSVTVEKIGVADGSGRGVNPSDRGNG